MGKSIGKEVIKYTIVLLIVRGVFVCFTKDAFIDVGFVGLIVGSILGRIIFLKYIA
ncbi:hypothetical protein [Anaerotignum sp. MB30-C6]|uniref:hypothetical protein n=1 Tax=Anaerotignum sp. MB30-C6 TaxID=3070814 RepID=UPI0027DC610F|nr:hypothetical protein [Anaerotignum sp. MB30-C6]WMI82169.1 hypothetical protein RBQ60_05385 [Anaerotignum sp. MB30-C6]